MERPLIVSQIHDEIVVELRPPPFEAEQFRSKKTDPTSVMRLLRKCMAPLGYDFVQWWWVENAAHGYEYQCAETQMSDEPLNAMEVLARVAKE